MATINRNTLFCKKVYLIIMLNSVVLQVSAEEALGEAIDCTSVKINYTNNPEWTHNERLDAMDKAFFESVDRFELCNLSNKSTASSSAASGSSQETNVNSGTEGGISESTASVTMKGTETGPEKAESTGTASTSKDSGLAENTNAESSGKKNGGRFNNGATPADIPNANNDDVIASQIRLAAEIEKDPAKKKKLWNEYRKYKRMPTQR